MRIPIPSDWDGQTWRCLELQWPDSREYNAVLLGLLSYLTRGRLWDERTGSVRDAQAIGWEIFNANYPLVPCRECDGQGGENPPPDQPHFDQPGIASGFPSEWEDESMGQVVTDVTVESGRLKVWFGPCCSKDLGAIADIVTSGDGSDIAPPWEDIEDAPVYSACAKATSIVEAVYNVVQEAFDETNNAPWQWVGHIESGVGYDLDNNWVLALMAAVMFAYTTQNMSFGDTVDTAQKQLIKANIAALMASDSTGVPTDTMFGQIRQVFGSAMTFDTYQGIYDFALQAIGRHDLDAIAKTGALENAAYDCAAPELPSVLFENFAVGSPWRYIWDFRDGLGGWEMVNGHQDANGMWGDSGTTDNHVIISARAPFTAVNNGSVLTNVAVVVQMIGDENLNDAQVGIGTDDFTMIGVEAFKAIMGDAPTAPGYHTVNGSGNDPLGSLEVWFNINLQAYHPDPGNQHPDEAAYSHKVIAVLYAGTGPGPLLVPPVYP